MRFSLIYITLLAVPPAAAFAGYRPFAFTYDTYPMVKGELEFEQWITWSGHTRQDHGFNRFDLREEIEWGVADNFRLSFYAPNWQIEQSKDRRGARFDTAGIEGILLLSNPVIDALG